MKNQFIFSVTGYKNAGKTTLVKNLIPYFNEKGLKVATIKHDLHDYEFEKENTDTYYHRQNGAYGTLVFSNNKYTLTKSIDNYDNYEDVNSPFFKSLTENFKECDVIIVEGLKNSNINKIEIITDKKIKNSKNVLCYAKKDYNFNNDVALDLPVFDLNDYKEIFNFIYNKINIKDLG